MATRYINRASGTGGLIPAPPGATPLQFDSADGQIKFLDDNSAVRTLAGLGYVEYLVNGAIALPTDRITVVNITKATAAAMTLADPTAALEGAIVVINTETAAAHTVTNTTGFNGAGAAGDVATWGGAIGDGMVLVALNLKWNVVIAKNVTLG